MGFNLMTRKGAAGLVAAGVLAVVPVAIASSAEAANTCSSQRIKIELSFQPDQAKAKATCTALNSNAKFKAVLTSSVFPDANSSWRETQGSVETGTRPWAGSSGSNVVIGSK